MTPRRSVVRSRSSYAPMSSERPLPWGGRRGKNLSSLRHISITVASALGVCQAAHQHGDTTIVLHSGPLAQESIYTVIQLHGYCMATHICRSARICTPTCISPGPAAILLHSVHLHINPHQHGDTSLARRHTCTQHNEAFPCTTNKHVDSFARQSSAQHSAAALMHSNSQMHIAIWRHLSLTHQPR